MARRVPAIHQELSRACWLALAALVVTGCVFVVCKHAQRKQPTVMAIGDSITYGFSSDPQVPIGGWTAMIPGVHIIDEAKCGATPASILPMAVKAVHLAQPAIITVEIGTNCFCYRQPERQAESQYHALVRAVRAADPSAKILIATIPPPHPMAHATRQERNVTVAETRTFNAFIRAYAAHCHYTVADVGRDAVFVPADYSDALHFTRNGYREIACVMAEALHSTTSTL